MLKLRQVMRTKEANPWTMSDLKRDSTTDAYAEAIVVVCASSTMGPDSTMREYMNILPKWVKPARPLASGHAILALAIGIADYFNDKRIAPLNQTVSQVLRLAPFDARLLSWTSASTWRFCRNVVHSPEIGIGGAV